VRIRKLDLTLGPDGLPTYDMVFGHGQADYWRDAPEGVAQLVMTRLEMYTGEWFLNKSDGTAWRINVLGKYTERTRDPAIRARILSTQGVTAINTYASQVNRQTRGDAVQVAITTQYGSASVPVSDAATPNVDVRAGR
jgi:hypothetical protein